jgi:acid phosphatase type 7
MRSPRRRRTAFAFTLSLAALAIMAVPGDAVAGSVVVAAGDIACEGDPCPPQRRTARLIRRIDPTAVLTLGDNQYPSGALHDFRSSYDPTWGRFRGRTYPSPGNHEYGTPGAAGYFAYFGRRAHPRTNGTYSFNLGRWHFVSINSGRGHVTSRQLRWLRRDLVRDRRRCELAYWHHPRWSSGREHGSDPAMAPLWRVLFRAGVDVVLNGHEHNYERFARLSPRGVRAPRRGIRQFVAGTGGADLYRLGAGIRGSQRRIDDRWGVLRLAMRARGYRWAFVGIGGIRLDRGSERCHG